MEIARKTDNMTVKHFFLIAALLYPILLSAQTDEFRAAYDSFRNQARKEYENFRQRANAEYAEWVKKAWRESKTLPAVPKPEDESVPPANLFKGSMVNPTKGLRDAAIKRSYGRFKTSPDMFQTCRGGVFLSASKYPQKQKA